MNLVKSQISKKSGRDKAQNTAELDLLGCCSSEVSGLTASLPLEKAAKTTEVHKGEMTHLGTSHVQRCLPTYSLTEFCHKVVNVVHLGCGPELVVAELASCLIAEDIVLGFVLLESGLGVLLHIAVGTKGALLGLGLDQPVLLEVLEHLVNGLLSEIIELIIL